MITGLIKKFGGMSVMARALGHKFPTTVQGWKDSGAIPHWRRTSIIDAAKSQGVKLLANELSYLGGDAGSNAIAVNPEALAGLGSVSERVLIDGSWALQLVYQAVDLVCLCKGGVIQYINDSGARRLGFIAPKQLHGRPFADFIHADYLEASTEMLSGEVTEDQPQLLKLLSRKGRELDAEVLFLSVGEAGSETVIVQAHDVTERLRSASAILHSETRYRALIEQALDMICICSNGEVTFINAAGAKMLGASSPTQIIGRELINMIHSDYQDIFTDGLGNFIAEGGVFPLKFVRLDGTVIDVEIVLMSIGNSGEDSFMMEAHDITEQVRSAETLRKAYDDMEQRVEERTRELTEEVAERRRAEDELKLSAEVIENLNEGVVIVGTDFRVTFVNPAYTNISGYSVDEVIGEHPPFHAAIKADPELRSKLNEDLERKGRWEGEFWCKHKNGEDYAMRLSLSVMKDEKGAPQLYVAVINDITKRKQDEERIYFQANYDSLTGLPNRSLFQDRLNQSLPTMSRLDKKLGLMFIDLDGFKLVNDTLGHDSGDLLLQETSRRLNECIRSGDTVARIGGDEFTVIMPNLDDPQNAPLLGQRILDSLAKPFDLNGQEAFISGSIGITIFPDDAKDATDLIKNADAAMYRAKDQGKANYQFFTADLNEDVKERLFLKNNLIKALEHDEFVLHYQPKLDILNGTVTSCEALMRWINEKMGGMVSPVRFIPIIEETGQVVEIGEWALWTACKQHKAWLAEGLPPIRIAVNLSARQLREPDFVQVVEKVLKDTGVSPDYLEIEITESMLMSDSERAVVALDQLHDMGLQVAMDDFGTGYSSLSYLKRFPIDTIKIDRSFVSDITTSPDDAEIIRTIITMGQTLNRKIVAEGVETEDQLELLRGYKCDEIQGYFFSRPMTSDDFVKFFEEKNLMAKA